MRQKKKKKKKKKKKTKRLRTNMDGQGCLSYHKLPKNVSTDKRVPLSNGEPDARIIQPLSFFFDGFPFVRVSFNAGACLSFA